MRWTAALLSLVLVACGGSELDKAVVTNLPNGNATGSAASGSYTLELVTRDCSGTCPTFAVLIFTVSICQVGDKNSASATVVQNGGRIDVSATGLLVDRLSGGINIDGTFDVGGAAPHQQYPQVALTERARGTIAPTGEFVAQAKAHGQGDVQGTSINCTGTYDVTGKRR